MKLTIIVGIFAILVLGGIMPTAFSQTDSLADHVVINEVEINPPGLDTASPIEWVELYNPTDESVDISGWKISSSPEKTLSIPQGTIILPGQFLIFFYTSAWFTDVAEVVQLIDDQGNLVDETPFLTDISNDETSWQRSTDGLDSDSHGDWIKKFSTPGKTIGKEMRIIPQTSDLEVSVLTDKNNYVFGETAIISGEVSERSYYQAPFFVADAIDVKITGPLGFTKVISLFPDFNLKFETTLKLSSALGIPEGVYDVSVEYGGVTDFTQFSLGHQESVIEGPFLSSLSVTTDEVSYIPNERITMTAHATRLIQFEPLKYKVQDPSGAIAIQGSVFPNEKEISLYMKTNRFSKGGTSLLDPNTQFITRGLIDPIAPVYGTYLVTVEYGTKTARTTFELVPEVIEDTLISLATNKPTYAPGETVTISGRLNHLYVPALVLEIVQTEDRSLQGSRGQTQSDVTFKELNGVTLEGDSTFQYEYQIPRTSKAVGGWSVFVRHDVGSAITYFNVVENPEDKVPVSTEPFFVTTDKDVYDISETVRITGKINQQEYRTDFRSLVVKIEVQTEDGFPIINPTHKPEGNKPLGSLYTKTAVPDASGNYWAIERLDRTKYAPGKYIVKASYDDPSVSKGERVGNYVGGTLSDTVKFTIRDTLYESGIDVKLDKSIYGLGETVHLTGTYPLTAQGTGIKIELTQPDGKLREFGTLVDAGRFSWSWDIPNFERTATISASQDRTPLVSTTALGSNYGVYLLRVGTDTGWIHTSFTVSPNPDEDFISLEPMTVSTDKSVYTATDKVHVTGKAQRVQQGDEGLVIPYRVDITIDSMKFPTSTFRLYASDTDRLVSGEALHIHRLKSGEAFLDNGGNFKATIDLPPTVFHDGTYQVSAVYQGQRAQTTFEVKNPFFIEEDQELIRAPLEMLISTDKDEYERGETVFVTTRPNKNVWMEKIRVALISEESRKINCGAFICGPGVFATFLIPDERTASYYHEEKIPLLGVSASESVEAVGPRNNPREIPDKETYYVSVSAEFGLFAKPITVWNIPKPILEAPPERFTEKFNRITESHIDIDFDDEKIIQGEDFHPRVIQGSLFTPNKGQESKVNLRVTTESGVCLVGPDPDCTVRESTRAHGVIYQAVTADGNDYKIRYWGHGAKLEKFTILPADPEGFLTGLDLDVDIQKEDQSSHFYYKVTFVDDEETI